MSAVTVQEVIDALSQSRRIFDRDWSNRQLAERIRTHGIAPPDGMMLVPIKPTEEALSAVLSITTDCHSAEESYRDILAAATKQENE